MKLALVHDLAECIVGDITPFCGVSPQEKEKRERVLNYYQFFSFYPFISKYITVAP